MMRAARFVVLAMMFAATLAACEEDVVVPVHSKAAKCGPKNCAADEYCCDATCGICAEQGIACTQTCE